MESLQKKYIRLEKEWHEVRQEMEDAETKKKLPVNKRKYEGKYWKYRNSDGQRRWWVYSHCLQVIDLRVAVFNVFEIAPEQCEFMVSGEQYFFYCEYEITKEEYDKQLKRFLNKVNKL